MILNLSLSPVVLLVRLVLLLVLLRRIISTSVGTSVGTSIGTSVGTSITAVIAAVQRGTAVIAGVLGGAQVDSFAVHVDDVVNSRHFFLVVFEWFSDLKYLQCQIRRCTLQYLR